MKAALRPPAALAVLLLCACVREPRVYSTWASQGQESPNAQTVPIEAFPPGNAQPWAGTVSHHLLAGAEIDRWFSELARRRRVKTFYLLSPSHWGLSIQDYSITDGSWRVPGGLVESDRKKAKTLAKRLGVEFEPAVFDYEHGASTLVPYISRHFPKARIVAVAYRGEPPLDQPMAQRLYEALASSFDDSGRRRDFLLISTDFSHHADRAVTDQRDARTRRFFESPSASTWIYSGCDNRPGMYALAKLSPPGTECAILFHTDSFALSGMGANDITTYFFSYFW